MYRKKYHSRWGEIGLIMLDKTESCFSEYSQSTLYNSRTAPLTDAILVFVEVRCRTSGIYGSPAATVDRRKQAKILNTARASLAKHTEYNDLPVRFDVVAVTRRNYSPKILWIRDAFQ